MTYSYGLGLNKEVSVEIRRYRMIAATTQLRANREEKEYRHDRKNLGKWIE
jgi:hypothetical protein